MVQVYAFVAYCLTYFASTYCVDMTPGWSSSIIENLVPNVYLEL